MEATKIPISTMTRSPTMTVSEFIQANETYFLESWSESNDHVVNDENFEQYTEAMYKEYETDNKSYTTSIMCDCYLYSICEC